MKENWMFRTIALAAAVSVGFAAEARADFNTGGAVCGGNSFSTCASVNLTSAVVNNKTVITVTIQNYGNNGELFKSIGLIGVPAGTTIALTSAPTGYGAPPPNDLSGAGLPGETWGSTANSQGDMLTNDGSTTFTFVFTFDRELTANELAALGVGVHAISGPNGCSTKMGVTAGGVVGNAGDYSQCSPPTTVPEPITMTLLATGLAGMSGMGFIRRRKKNELV